jgi:hypothetical protein
VSRKEIAMRGVSHLIFAVLLVVMACHGVAGAGQRFRKVAESGVLDPSGTFVIEDLDVPVMHDGKVAFRATGDDRVQGIYTDFNGVLEAVAMSGTSMPAVIPGEFDSFASSLRINERGVVFRGSGQSLFGGVRMGGIYAWRDDALGVVIDGNTPAPGLNDTFSYASLGGLALDGDQVAFRGGVTEMSVDRGIYRTVASGIAAAISPGTRLPGQSEDLIPSGVMRLDGDELTVNSGHGPRGVVSVGPSGPEVLLDLEAEMSKWFPSAYALYGIAGSDDGAFALAASSSTSSYAAIFLAQDGESVEVLTQADSSLDGGHFTEFSTVGMDGDLIVFSARTSANPSGGRGLFAWQDGQVDRILGLGDMLDGKTVTNVWVNDGGLRGEYAAVSVYLDDLSEAIYVVRVPEPSALLTVLGGSLWCLRRRRRRAGRD